MPAGDAHVHSRTSGTCARVRGSIRACWASGARNVVARPLYTVIQSIRRGMAWRGGGARRVAVETPQDRDPTLKSQLSSSRCLQLRPTTRTHNPEPSAVPSAQCPQPRAESQEHRAKLVAEHDERPTATHAVVFNVEREVASGNASVPSHYDNFAGKRVIPSCILFSADCYIQAPANHPK